MANAAPLSVLEFWMAIDRGNYAQSWDAAAPMFQRIISKEEWVGMMEKTRRPLGKVLSRQERSLKFAPGGSLFDAIYVRSFDSQRAAVENVTCAMQSNGEWRIISYFIKPDNSECPTTPGVFPEGTRVTPALPDTPPRFSRPAIMGAVWIGLFFLNWVVCYTPPGWMLKHLFRDSSFDPIVEAIVFVPLLLLGFAALAGGPLMGVLALRQIWQSRGAIHGFGLALFDVLFLPLALLNCWAVWLARLVASQIASASLVEKPVPGTVWPTLLVLVPVGLILNGLLIRSAGGWLGGLSTRPRRQPVHILKAPGRRHSSQPRCDCWWFSSRNSLCSKRSNNYQCIGRNLPKNCGAWRLQQRRSAVWPGRAGRVIILRGRGSSGEVALLSPLPCF